MMGKFLKLSFFCVIVSLCRSNGNAGFLAKEYRDTIQICCKQGEVNGYGLRSSKPKDCTKFDGDELPSSVPQGLDHELLVLCRIFRSRCCENFIQESNECEVGINYTIASVESCNQLNDTAKMCCNECRNGSQVHSYYSKGCSGQLTTAKDKNELLKVNAFRKCCKMDRCSAASPVPHRCQHYCHDYGGIEVVCSCMHGSKLGADGKSCEG